MIMNIRDEVFRGRRDTPLSFPGFGSTDTTVVGRRMVASLLDAGWCPPSRDQVVSAGDRSATLTARFTGWLDSLSPDSGRATGTTTQSTVRTRPTCDHPTES